MSVLRAKSWRAASFVAVDVETTGLDPRHDEVISFAAVPVEQARIIAERTVTGLVRPERSPPPRTIEIHGLRAADLAGAPPANEALRPLAAALQGHIPVAHFAWVERTFLAPRLRAAGGRLPRRIVDTALLWRLLCIGRGEGDPGTMSLAAVAGGLGLPVHRQHEAEGDALTTAQAFLALATHLEVHGRGSAAVLTSARWHVRGWQLFHEFGSRP